MTMIGGLDVHRTQITYEWVDRDTDQGDRGRAGRPGGFRGDTSVAKHPVSGLRRPSRSGSRMFSSAVRVGTRSNPWKTNPPATFGAVFASSLRAEAEEITTDLVVADALVRAPAAGSVPNSAVRTS